MPPFAKFVTVFFFVCVFFFSVCDFFSFRNFKQFTLIPLTLATLSADSADDKLMIFFLFFLEDGISFGDNLHELLNPIHRKRRKIFQNVVC